MILMSQLNFWSITTGYDVKYLLSLGIEQLKLISSTSEKSEQVCSGGAMASSASFWLYYCCGRPWF